MDEQVLAEMREYLVARRAQQFALLATLVKIDSPAAGGGCAAILSRLIDFLEPTPFEVHRHEIPDALAEPLGLRKVANLIVRHRFGPGPTIALSAHCDTIIGATDETRDPLAAVVENGRMYGRGVADGKSDIVCYLYAMLALAEAGGTLSGTVEIHITSDSATDGELGARWLLAEGLSQPDYAIVSGRYNAIGATATGVLELDVKFRGRALPLGSPMPGVDVVEGASRAMVLLFRQRDELRKVRSKITGIGAASLVVTGIACQAEPNMSPGEIDLHIDRRLLPDEDVDTVEDGLATLLAVSLAGAAGVVGKVRRRRLLPAMVSDSATKPLVQAFLSVGSEISGSQMTTYGVATGTVARHYSAAGVPTVLYGAGPSDINRGGAADSLDLDNLRVATEVVAAVLAKMLK